MNFLYFNHNYYLTYKKVVQVLIQERWFLTLHTAANCKHNMCRDLASKWELDEKSGTMWRFGTMSPDPVNDAMLDFHFTSLF